MEITPATTAVTFSLRQQVAMCIAIILTGWAVHQGLTWQQSNALPMPIKRAMPLEWQEKALARKAWTYFKNNRIEETGLVASAAKFPATTMWDVASQLAGMTAAREMDLLPAAEFDKWMTQLLVSLTKLPLYKNELPNKAYNARTLMPVDYGKLNKYKEIGFSAIDLGRLALWLDIVANRYPQHTTAAKAVTARWKLARLEKEGSLMGTHLAKGKEQWVQEGRLGYEQYAAYGLTKIGVIAKNALNPKANEQLVDVSGVKIPADTRTTYHNYVTSEPYVLDGLETGFKALPAEYAGRLLQAQTRRSQSTGEFVAWSEDNIDQAPFFLYNNVYVDGKPWNVVSPKGKDFYKSRVSSTKTAVSWHMLFRNPYTEKNYKALRWVADPGQGVFGGVYEETQQINRSLTLNTNGQILQAVLFSKIGQPLEDWAYAKKP
jgi:Protein of unknown function (DUF3131)